MKEKLKSFLLVTVVIFCLTAFSLGFLTVKERGEYNLYLTKYATMSFSNNSEKLKAEISENRYRINVPLKRIEGEIEKYICFTPLSLPYYLIKFIV